MKFEKPRLGVKRLKKRQTPYFGYLRKTYQTNGIVRAPVLIWRVGRREFRFSGPSEDIWFPEWDISTDQKYLKEILPDLTLLTTTWMNNIAFRKQYEFWEYLNIVLVGREHNV